MTLPAFDLSDLLQFKPEQGEISLADSRVMLMNESAMESLQQTLYEQLGARMARMILARFGYESALRDYQNLETTFPDLTDEERLSIGPLMHSWSGLVKVRVLERRFDRKKGDFYFRGQWTNSYEAKIHLRTHGQSKKPVCYSLTGYGSGWCSAFMGRPMLEVETKCVARGDDVCEWEIRPLKEWGGEADDWRHSLSSRAGSVYQSMRSYARKFYTLNDRLEDELEQRIYGVKHHLRLLCHDLQAPLSLALSEIHHASRVDSSLLQKIHTPLMRAQNILSNSRMTALLEDDKCNLQLACQDLSPVITQVVEICQRDLDRKNVSVLLDLKTDVFANFDVNLLRDHVLVNILMNSIKFSYRGSRIVISFTRCLTGFVGIQIQDFGIGIPESLKRQIFELRHGGSRPGTEGELGSGYGLALAKATIEKMGGRLEIQSLTISEDLEKHGTKVTIWIPFFSI